MQKEPRTLKPNLFRGNTAERAFLLNEKTCLMVILWDSFYFLGFQPDEEMSEIFKTEFQMRLLWGSKGAQVNQNERYEKFSQILTALSRKLEPPPMKQVEQLSI